MGARLVRAVMRGSSNIDFRMRCIVLGVVAGVRRRSMPVRMRMMGCSRRCRFICHGLCAYMCVMHGGMRFRLGMGRAIDMDMVMVLRRR